MVKSNRATVECLMWHTSPLRGPILAAFVTYSHQKIFSMSVQHHKITEQDDVGQRLDNYLVKKLKGVPRGHIYKVIRGGQVRVNGGRIKAGYRLQLDDDVRIPPIRTSQPKPIVVAPEQAQHLENSVLFEDQNLLVVNKPAGMAVHGGSGVAGGVIETLRESRQAPRLELVHRLDKGTSGCLAVAKNRQTLASLQASFRAREVSKVYHVLVHGAWPASVRSVQLRLKRYETAWGERKVRVDHQGQTARTDFEVLQRGAAASYLQATLHTGRTHQIRVHCAAQGCPLIGDDKYGSAATRAEMDQADHHHLGLHAHKLALPYEGQILKLTAEPPPAFKELWGRYQVQAAPSSG